MPNDVITRAIDALASGHDLPREQAGAVLGEIMRGDASESQIAGFLIALRTKGETEDELAGLPSPLTVGRYHSLVVAEDAVPDAFEISARGGGVVMAIRHRELPAEGVQFHPESVLTESGKAMLQNFLGPEDRS